MLKITFLVRFALYVFLSWLLLVALWLCLPSPSRESGDPNAYSTSILKSGKTLTRVYEFEDFFPYESDSLPEVRWSSSTKRQAFALSYKLSLCKQILIIGDAETTLNLTIDASLQLPHISDAFEASVKVGDRDGLNPAWFADADSMLLYWGIHRQSTYIWLRARWLNGHQLQIWPESRFLKNGFVSDVRKRKAVEPLLTLVTFATDVPSFQAIMPSSATSSSPSLTYPLRVAIMAVLVPPGLAVKGIFQVCGRIIGAAFGIARLVAEILTVYLLWELACWVWRGRPPAREHLKTSFPSKHIYAFLTRESESSPRIWGATGPLDTEGMDDEGMVVLRTRPLRNVWDFFRSSSPLDDLFITFETAKGFYYLRSELQDLSTVPTLHPARHQERWKNTHSSKESSVYLTEKKTSN